MAYNKYGNIKISNDGHVFDSKKEYDRYIVLKMMEKAGMITDLELQPEYILQEGFKKGGKTWRPIIYRADFRYKDERGNVVVEDVKGFRTKEFEIKQKLFEYKYEERLTLI